MNIIKCPVCGNNVSDEAPVCPHCGQPIKPLVIEQTSKKWKTIKLVSWSVFLVGFFSMIGGAGNGGFQNPLTGFGLMLTFIGFIAISIASFGSWWNHK